MIQYPGPMVVHLPMNNLRYARSYVLDQPYTCVVSPCEALRAGTIFPFLLEVYLPGLQKAERGGV